MDFQVSFNLNESIYLRDPESSELGKKIVSYSINLIFELGFEAFTFKKLAVEIGTTEASIYRYFENKHRLLLYILNWYWLYISFLIDFQTQNITAPKQKLETILKILTSELSLNSGSKSYNTEYIHEIVIAESSKVYLIKDVDKVNKNHVYKAYKDLCASVAAVIIEYNRDYPYPISLTSTIIEAAHQQQYFRLHLPRLSDANDRASVDFEYSFLSDLLFKVLD